MKKFFLIALTALWLFADSAVERAALLLDDATVRSHKRLIALLFEDDGRFRHGSGYDMVKIASVLKENGLLHLKLPRFETVELTFESGAGNPLFFMKAVDEVLRSLGMASFMSRHARLDGNGFIWRVAFRTDAVPDPVLMAKRFAKRGAEVVDMQRLEGGQWRYRIDMSRARIEAVLVHAGDIRKIVRPVRPVWVDVSKIKNLTIQELPGSHWYADVVVYDKMLRILSIKQNDTRTRYVRLRLPSDAAYVKIGDRFTLENLRSGVKLSARGER
ncbi:hypothetical protein [Hydrogenimonas urashimensis]|uniref:hypothetical protein n=1 Tax=Hydrogenimonas urashimensis TaxID=2740515 RepID=UPI001915AE6A|nr:hypothetical protein [Hydrogenimonas urashimensis]